MGLAWHNLARDPTRFALSVISVGVSVGLMLLLAGYRSGVYQQATAYLDNTPGSLVVAERGIRDFLGTSSILPAHTETAVYETAGVARVIPVVAQFVVFERHQRKDGFFLIGYDPVMGGGPWRLVAGREPTTDAELVMDRTTADQHQLRIGDRIALLDRDATVVGLSDETTFWAGSMAFARISMLDSLARAPDLRSFLIVTPANDVGVDALRSRLAIPGTTVLAKAEVIANDRALMARVYDAPIGLMVIIAFGVGVLMIGLVIYTATIERRREYGALKAIGAHNRTLYRVVTVQALLAAGAGALLGVALAYGGGAALTAWRPQFLVVIEPVVMALVVASSLLMALLAAFIPARSVARLEPAEVFRG